MELNNSRPFGATPITAEELAVKLYRKCPHWFDGAPGVEVEGNEKEFGRVNFYFGKKGGTVTIKCYLYNKKEIEYFALDAVANFSEHINNVYKRG